MKKTEITKALILRDGLTCQYCGCAVVKGSLSKVGLVIEHVNGRSDDLCNLCVSCRSCNSQKNNRTGVEWAASITEKYIRARKEMVKVARIETLLERLSI